MGKIIAFDTNCFIYLVENHPKFKPLIEEIFNQAGNDEIKLVSSVVTTAEVMVRPLKLKNKSLIDLYKSIFQAFPNLILMPIDLEASFLAAELRAKYDIKLPDAFQLAAAIQAGANFFLSNDEKLKKVKEIKVTLLRNII